MSTGNVEKLLYAGGKDKVLRAKYNIIETKAEFVASAAADGFEFTVAELDAVLAEEGMDFECSGNPRSRQIWLR